MAYAMNTKVRVTNESTGDFIAERVVKIGVFDFQVHVSDWDSNSQPLSYWALYGMPTNLTAFYSGNTANATGTRLLSTGWVNLIKETDVIGQRWSFSNGNYIVFAEGSTSSLTLVEFYTADGTFLRRQSNMSGRTLPCLYTRAPTDPLPDTDFWGCDLLAGGLIEGTSIRKLTIRAGAATSGDRQKYIPQDAYINSSMLFYNDLEIFGDDPFAQGGFSDVGGGDGDFDGTSEDIPIPGNPSFVLSSNGFVTAYTPTATQISDLASYMWSGLFDPAGWKKLFADPMDCILGLSVLPVTIPQGALTPLWVGNISTGIQMYRLGSQYVTVDCGEINVNEFWGAYLDYEPYTKCEIYLPYIGTHSLSVDDIMNKTINVVYHIDVISGACVAFIKCDNSVLYQFTGSCSQSLPITGNDWGNLINGTLSIARSGDMLLGGGSAAVPSALGNIAATAANQMKTTIRKSGTLSGCAGFLGIQTPYLILTRPNQAVPESQNEFMGYPSFTTVKLSDISGYTEIERIHLTGISATDDELTEIETLLKEGVII